MLLPWLGLLAANTPFDEFAARLRSQQARMVDELTRVDPTLTWTKDEHERGCAMVLSDGEVWEKGCVSITVVDGGVLTRERAAAISTRTADPGIAEGAPYAAAALSFVLHARSPRVPTLRGDARLFRVEAPRLLRGAPAAAREWYGGGLDLTPSLVVDADCRHFHERLRALCDAHAEPATTYARMKASCDDYFWLPARREHRGVGGVFFDDCGAPWARDFALALLDAAVDADGPYLPIVNRTRDLPFGEADKRWQLLRRGRYVEFNLLYDRGVKFGLNPESIERVLVSSPPTVAWEFRAEPEPGSEEARTLEILRCAREWVDSDAAAPP